jgi:hypothetical protein
MLKVLTQRPQRRQRATEEEVEKEQPLNSESKIFLKAKKNF